jgi:Excalibur calcium-binding domain
MGVLLATAAAALALTATACGPPPNPGNSKNCSDFRTQAEAQAWFNKYYPHYGDVADLDRDNDLIACEEPR